MVLRALVDVSVARLLPSLPPPPPPLPTDLTYFIRVCARGSSSAL